VCSIAGSSPDSSSCSRDTFAGRRLVYLRAFDPAVWLETVRRERITNAIGFDAIVGADRITVSILDNNVTLTGTVRSPEHRTAALTAAATFPGVLDVHDQITVRAYP